MFPVERILEEMPRYLPIIIISVLVIVAVKVIQWLWLGKRLNKFAEKQIIPQVMMIIVYIVGTILIILALPIGEELRGQILSLLGLLLTAVMALSSATFISNMFAGTMLRLVRSFRVGDFVRVSEQMGRVSARGIFHTEIQTEDGDLTTFPNLYLITNPVTVVRKSATIISAKVSLGYDLDHRRIEGLLIEAAKESGLEDPFVHVLSLGDFSITYKICGVLKEVKTLLTSRSNLKKSVLDALHGDGVEIVSPTFMNQRPQAVGTVSIPPRRNNVGKDLPSENSKPEEVIFDKAESEEAKVLNREEKPEEE